MSSRRPSTSDSAATVKSHRRRRLSACSYASSIEGAEEVRAQLSSSTPSAAAPCLDLVRPSMLQTSHAHAPLFKMSCLKGKQDSS